VSVWHVRGVIWGIARTRVSTTVDEGLSLSDDRMREVCAALDVAVDRNG
jgi:hypothetical protein